MIKLTIGKPVKLNANEIDIILVDKNTRELYHEVLPLLEYTNLELIKKMIREITNSNYLFKYAVTLDKMYIPDETGELKEYPRHMSK